MEEKLVTKDDLLNKLRAYSDTPDDDNIVYKQKIKDALLSNPTLLYLLHEKDLEVELFDEDDDFSSESSANKFKIVEMDDCYIMCKTPNSPLTYNEKREFMTGLILYDNTKEKKSKTTHFCILTEAEKSKLVTYKANENAVYYVKIVGLKGLKCKKELKSIKKYLNEL